MTTEQLEKERDEQVARLATRLIDQYAWYFEASKEEDEIRLMNFIKTTIKAEIFAAETRGLLEADAIMNKVTQKL